ncbi:MAG: hypothetical protein R3A50_09805 [Saprospiraceae bacterium]
MKTPLLLILIGILCLECYGQQEVKFTTTEVLDSYEKKFRHWGGENEIVRFMVIRRTTGEVSEVYAQCEVENKDWEVVGKSSGFAGGSNGWAIGVSDVQKLAQRKGVIQFSATDFNTLISYLNQYLVITKSGDPEFDKTWSATFSGRFSFSLSYSPSRPSKWVYILSVDDANFEIPADDSLEMVKKLAGFRKFLQG